MLERCINLTFHGVGEPERPLEPGEDAVWLTRGEFTDVLDRAATRPDVRLTFDDGNASDLHIALPELRKRRLSAIFFVVAGHLGEPAYLDRDDVRELAAAGMRIGCHGMRHVPWRGLDDEALHQEMVAARRELEAVVGAPVREAACPFGAYDRRVLRALRSAGYERAWTSDRGAADPDAWLQVRNTVAPGVGADIVDRVGADPVRDRVTRRAKLAVKRWR